MKKGEDPMEARERTILEIARSGDTSEGQLFDELSQGLASGAISRRRALKLAGAALLGSTGLLSLLARTAGAGVPISGGCGEDEPRITDRVCPSNRCNTAGTCLCVETVRGTNRCVDATFPRSWCPEQDQCDRNRDCHRGQICIKTGGCCPGSSRNNVCARPCN